MSTNLNFVEREKQTEKFWKEQDIFAKSMEYRKDSVHGVVVQARI